MHTIQIDKYFKSLDDAKEFRDAYLEEYPYVPYHTSLGILDIKSQITREIRYCVYGTRANSCD